MVKPTVTPKDKTPKPVPLFFKVFPRTNWAGSECFRVEITYANGLTRSLAPEFKDQDGALRYMDRFHNSMPQQQA